MGNTHPPAPAKGKDSNAWKFPMGVYVLKTKLTRTHNETLGQPGISKVGRGFFIPPSDPDNSIATYRNTAPCVPGICLELYDKSVHPLEKATAKEDDSGSLQSSANSLFPDGIRGAHPSPAVPTSYLLFPPVNSGDPADSAT